MNSFNILNTLIIVGLVISAFCVFFLDDMLQCIIAMAVLGGCFCRRNQGIGAGGEPRQLPDVFYRRNCVIFGLF